MDTCELCNALDAADSIAVGTASEPVVVLVCWKCAAKLSRERCVEEIVFKILETKPEERTPGTVNFFCMVESGQGPHLNTDDTFFHGWANAGGRQFEGDTPMVKAQYMEAARAAGVSTQGKVYQHGLARFQGDPEAWVGSRGEMVKILERRGWGCERLGVKARPADAPPERVGGLADDIVREKVARRLEGVPAADRTPTLVADTAAAVRADHSPAPAVEPTRRPRDLSKKKTRAKGGA